MGVQTDRADLADRICAAEADVDRLWDYYADVTRDNAEKETSSPRQVEQAWEEYKAAVAVLRRLLEEEGS
jgi:plasmid stabilization system protein ParE